VDDHQIGQEDSVTAYVAELVGVLREVRRILRPDGTLWLNLGDVRGRNPGAQGATGQRASRPSGAAQAAVADRRRATAPKSLVGLPWRVAFALVDDGWILRADIIWVKPRPMPESVTDRPTSSHEYVFLLARSRRYYYDAKAIATAAVKSASRNKRRRYGDDRSRSGDHLGASVPWEGDTANARDVWVIDHDDAVDRVPGHHALMPVELARRCVLAGSRPGDLVLDPFSGMASTGLAAVGAGRPYTGIELNPAYLATSAERLRSLDPTAPLRPSATAHWSLFERT
jgi:DNA modification methylase